MNTQPTDKIHWSENVIIADADYIDRVAFNLIVNFERMLDRRIAAADLSRWAIDIALDGRLKPGNNETQLILLHDKKNLRLDNFAPAAYATDLNGKAFRDERLGEFIVNCIDTDDTLAVKTDVIVDIVGMLLGHDEVKRLMIVPDGEDGTTWPALVNALSSADDEKHITLFAMQPMQGGNFRQEILGYSLMNAMGITQSELDEHLK